MVKKSGRSIASKSKVIPATTTKKGKKLTEMQGNNGDGFVYVYNERRRGGFHCIGTNTLYGSKCQNTPKTRIMFVDVVKIEIV